MNLKKTYWIINQYASTPETAMGGRHYYLAKELVELGHTVYIIAANNTHLLRKSPKSTNLKTLEKNDNTLNMVWVKTLPYKNAHSLGRILNWLIFAFKLLFLKNSLPRPNCIVYSSPSLLGYPSAYYLAKKTKAKIVFEVRDIWPLTLQKIGGYRKNNPLIWMMQKVEDFAYKNSDHCISNLPLAYKHMQSRGLAQGKFDWVPNGYSELEVSSQLQLNKETQEQIPSDKFIIGYAGTVGKANALENLLNTAKLLEDYNEIHFLIVGNGKEKSELLKQKDLLKLKNLSFIKAIPKKEIHSLLSNFDICYAGFKKTSLYEFGTSLNKLPEYFMSQKPVIFSIDSPFKPVEEANAGITVAAEDPIAVKKAVLEIKNMAHLERQKLGQNGRNYAQKTHCYKKIGLKLDSILNNLEGNSATS